VLGTVQATEAIKYILGCGTLLVGRMLTWDALAMKFREVQLPLEKRCKVCNEKKRFTAF
jgi:molybdopterin/thiamine biosynthesis adenylyltransferase